MFIPLRIALEKADVIAYIKPLTQSERRPQIFIPKRKSSQPLLYHQIGNIDFFIFITNQ